MCASSAAIAALIPYAIGIAYVCMLINSPKNRWLWWNRLDTVVAILLALAGLTALVAIGASMLAIRRGAAVRTPVRRISLCVGALSLGLVLAIAVRWDTAIRALNIIIPEGGLSELGNNPRGTYIAGTIIPASATGLRVLYLENANGVVNIATPNEDGCFVAQATSAGQFGVFLDDHYWPLKPHVGGGYFRVVVTLVPGTRPDATMAIWERISALAYIDRAIGCRHVGRQSKASDVAG